MATKAPAAEESTAAHISTSQMRRLHALLRDHGIVGDKAIHDYLSCWLEEHGHDPVESRKELHTLHAAELITELEEAEVATAPTAAALGKLRAVFPPEAIGKLPRSTCKGCSDNRGTCDRHREKFRCETCGNWHSASSMHIDFVGHADVTARLLEVDPFWTWRPFTTEELNGIPPDFRAKGLWIMLTVCGVDRPGFGDAEGGKGPKEAIGDALRNAAMRFGVALDLWAKGDREWARAEKDGAETGALDPAAPRQDTHEQPQRPPAAAAPAPAEVVTTDPALLAGTPAQLADLTGLAVDAGTDLAGITAKWRADHGGLSVADLQDCRSDALAGLAATIRDYMAKNAPAKV